MQSHLNVLKNLSSGCESSVNSVGGSLKSPLWVILNDLNLDEDLKECFGAKK